MFVCFIVKQGHSFRPFAALTHLSKIYGSTPPPAPRALPKREEIENASFSLYCLRKTFKTVCKQSLSKTTFENDRHVIFLSEISSNSNPKAQKVHSRSFGDTFYGIEPEKGPVIVAFSNFFGAVLT